MVDDKHTCTKYPTFPAGTKSLLSKTLTKAMWEEYKDAKSDMGFTFGQAINSGVVNVDSGIGVYAGDVDSYTKYAKLFEPIIETYHGCKVATLKHPAFKADEVAFEPLKDDGMIVSTRIRVGRNLKGYPLGPGISDAQRVEVEGHVKAAVAKMTGDLAGTYYPLNSLSDKDRQALIDDHFLFKEGDRFMAAIGMNSDWPNARSIFHNADKTGLVWVNEEDQLRIISMQKGGDINAVFNRLMRMITALSAVAEFDYHPKYGAVTSCPTNLGTAMRASVHIAVPKLAKDMKRFEEIASKYNLQIRGTSGEHSDAVGGVYDLSNKRRLGLSEQECVTDMYNGVKAIIEAEKAMSV